MRGLAVTQRKQKPTNSPSLQGFLPKFVINFLKDHKAEYNKLKRTEQYGVAKYLLKVGLRHDHNTVEEASTIHWQDHKALFGRAGRFRQVNTALGGWFVDITEPHYRTGEAVAWVLNDEAQRLLNDLLELPEEFCETDVERGLVRPNGRSYKIPADGIESRTKAGSQCRYGRGLMRPVAEVDGEGLHRFHHVAQGWLSRKPCPEGYEWAYALWKNIANRKGQAAADDRATRARNQAAAMLYVAKASDIETLSIPTTYKESRAGRLYATGDVNLQQSLSEVRKVALAGCFDIDLANCHWSILSQLADRLGVSVPSIKSYLDDKNKIRQEIAHDAGSDIKDAKACLLAMIYGGSVHTRNGEIEKTLGTEAVEKLRSSETVKAFQADLRKLLPVIVSHYENKVKKSGYLINDAGRQFSVKEENRHKLAFILQGAESVALEAMLNVLKDDVAVLCHDGLVAYHEPDRMTLETAIADATGYELKLEIEPL